MVSDLNDRDLASGSYNAGDLTKKSSIKKSKKTIGDEDDLQRASRKSVTTYDDAVSR